MGIARGANSIALSVMFSRLRMSVGFTIHMERSMSRERAPPIEITAQSQCTH